MKHFDAVQEAARLRAARTSREIATGVNYIVGLPVGEYNDDVYYVKRIGPDALTL